MPSVTFEIPIPRSVNQTAGSGRYKRHRLKTGVQRDLAMLLLAAEVPRPIPGDRVHATCELRFPTRRRRDEGNYRAPLEKSLGDALDPVAADAPFRWLSDDTPEHFTFGAVTFAVDNTRTQPYGLLTLTWGDDL